MESLSYYPLLVFAAAFGTLWLASVAGSWLRRRNLSTGDERNEDIGVILAATLTLLALIVGFSFSMATSRYDQRKNSRKLKPMPMPLELKSCVPTFYRRQMPQTCASLLATTPTSASCSTSIGDRIPPATWWLMAAIALCSNVLFGYRSRNGGAAGKLALVLPLVVSIAFLLIADIDAPWHGLIQVSPQNPESLAKSLER